MSPQKNQSGEIVRSVWKQLFVKYGLYKSQWVQILSGGGISDSIFHITTHNPATNPTSVHWTLVAGS